jgi:soluble lytic murein transglycosylase
MTIGLGFALLVSITMSSACQRNAPPKITYPPTRIRVAQTIVLSPSAIPSRPNSPTPKPTLTPTFTLTLPPTHTIPPAPTPTPTPTPVPSVRLAAAQQAFAWGDYTRARDEFTALLADPAADEAEARLAAYWVGRSALEAGDHRAALIALQEFALTYPTDPQLAAVHFLMARAYEELEDWQRAIGAYQAYFDTGDEVLAVYAYRGMGEAAMLALDYERAAQAFADGLRVAPDNSWVVQLRESIAQSKLVQGDPLSAIEQYDAILSIARLDTYRAEILYLAGQTLMAAGDLEAAYDRYAQAVNRYPRAYHSYLALIEMVEANVPVDDYQRGLVDYYAKAYQPAIEAFTRHIEANPQSYREDARWYLALSLKGNGNLSQSIQQFNEFIEAHPQNEQVAEAWLEIAEAYTWRDDIPQALETYRGFADKEPRSQLAATALWEAAELELTSGNLQKAALSFRDLVARYPEDESAPEALFKAALLDYRRADLEAAQNGWQTLIQDYPDSQASSAARFWLGKTWLALEDPDQAKAAFETAQRWAPTSYYGLRAKEMLDGASEPATDPASLHFADPEGEQALAEDWIASWLPLTHTLALSAPNPAIVESPSFQRGDALLAAGRRADALEEFEIIKDEWWDNPLALYQLALAFRDRGLHRLSIICAERLTWLSPTNSRTEVPLYIQRLSFPIYYQELVVAEAQAQAMTPLLLFALIRQESLFEPSISSPADARGLTQVIPATGEWIAGRLGWAEFEKDELWLPYVNIYFGSWYLSLQLSTFQGEIIPALAAYNAGPGHIHNWLSDTPDVDLFVETIPFVETGRYVRNVYENYAHYRRLYQPAP